MKPVPISPGPDQQLITYTAPRGWDHAAYGECADLPVVFDGRFKTCTSAWRPSEKELALLNAGCPVFVQIVGGQPAMAIFVEDTTNVQIIKGAGIVSSARESAGENTGVLQVEHGSDSDESGGE